MAGFMFPGLLSDWTDGIDPRDPRLAAPQGLLADPSFLMSPNGQSSAASMPSMAPDAGYRSPDPGFTMPVMSGAQASPMPPTMQAFQKPDPVDDPFGGDPRFNRQPAPQNGMAMPAIPGPNNPIPQFSPVPSALAGQTGALEGSPEAKAFADRPAQNATPAGGAPFTPPQANKDEPGTLEKLSTVLGGIYGQGGPGDGLINLGLALMSPGNKAENIMRAGQMAQLNDYKKSQLLASQQKQMREMLALQGNMETLKKAYPDWSPQQLAAGAQSPQIVQEAVKVLSPSEVWTPVTDPAERAKMGIPADDTAPYIKDRTGKIQAVGRAVTNNVVNNSVNPILKGLGDQFSTMREEANSSADAIRAIHNARSQLDSDGGIVSGAFANNRIALQKMGALFGITDPSQVVNTETFLTQIKPQVLAMLKATGSNPSNADRDFAAAMSGADPKLAEQTIRRTLDFNEQSARGKIDRFNSMSDQMLAAQPDLKNVAPMLRVQPPGQYAPPTPAPQTTTSPPTQQPAPPVAGARQAGDGNWYVPDPSRPGKYLKVQ